MLFLPCLLFNWMQLRQPAPVLTHLPAAAGLPWSVALPLSNGCWSTQQLHEMAAARSTAWQQQCQQGRVPQCLQEMLAYARSLSHSCCPDYGRVYQWAQALPDLVTSSKQPEE